MSDIQAIAASVHALAEPGMKPKDLISAVRARHPEASKKQVVRAAFYAVITQADADPEQADRIQAVALSERSHDDAEAKSPEPRRKTRRKPKA